MAEPRGNLGLFALEASRAFGERVARQLQLPLSEHEERGFEDGEHRARPLVGVRGQDVYVVQSLHGDDGGSVNDKLCRLLFFIGARAHELGRVFDWVVVYFHSDDEPEGQCTVVTETRGELVGRRVVRGREPECRTHYAAAAGE